MAHLLHRHLDQLGAPTAHGSDLLRTQALGLAVLEAERRIEVGAHQVVLELRCLVEGMQDCFATLKTRADRIHECSAMKSWMRSPRKVSGVFRCMVEER